MEGSNYTPPQQIFDNSSGPQMTLSNATAVLVLGIVSIPTCCCYGLGIVCGIIALVLSKKDSALYLAAPQSYTVASYNNLKAGKICAIIGIVLSGIYIVMMIAIIALKGTGALNDPEAIKRMFQ